MTPMKIFKHIKYKIPILSPEIRQLGESVDAEITPNGWLVCRETSMRKILANTNFRFVGKASIFTGVHLVLIVPATCNLQSVTPRDGSKVMSDNRVIEVLRMIVTNGAPYQHVRVASRRFVADDLPPNHLNLLISCTYGLVGHTKHADGVYSADNRLFITASNGKLDEGLLAWAAYVGFVDPANINNAMLSILATQIDSVKQQNLHKSESDVWDSLTALGILRPTYLDGVKASITDTAVQAQQREPIAADLRFTDEASGYPYNTPVLKLNNGVLLQLQPLKIHTADHHQAIMPTNVRAGVMGALASWRFNDVITILNAAISADALIPLCTIQQSLLCSTNATQTMLSNGPQITVHQVFEVYKQLHVIHSEFTSNSFATANSPDAVIGRVKPSVDALSWEHTASGVGISPFVITFPNNNFTSSDVRECIDIIIDKGWGDSTFRRAMHSAHYTNMLIELAACDMLSAIEDWHSCSYTSSDKHYTDLSAFFAAKRVMSALLTPEEIKSRLDRSIDEIKRFPDIEAVKVVLPNIIVRTNMLTTRTGHTTLGERLIGRLEITINLLDLANSITSIINKTLVASEHMHAPHVHAGKPCLGSAAAVIGTALSEIDITTVVIALLDLVQRPNMDDIWGRRVCHFPHLDGTGGDVTEWVDTAYLAQLKEEHKC